MAKKKILIIDDDSDFRDFVSDALGEEGYETFVAEGGSEGIRLCCTENPDLILLDISMPGMDGFEVCELIHENSNVPVIFISVERSSQIIDRVAKSAACYYLPKPIRMDELLSHVRAILKE